MAVAFVFNYAYREEGNEPLDVLGYLESLLDERLFVNDPGVSRSWMWRDESIGSYNNLFGNTYNISRLITQRGVENVRQDLATNLFTTLGPHGKEAVSIINVNYSYANYAYWEYNKTDNRYYRYQGNVDLDGLVEPEYILLTDANNDSNINQAVRKCLTSNSSTREKLGSSVTEAHLKQSGKGGK